MGNFSAFETATGILKEQQKGMITQLRNEESPLLKKIIPNTDKVVGSDVKFSAQIEYPQGFGSRRSASGGFPTAVAGKYLPIIVPTGRAYFTWEFDRKMLEAAGNSKAGEAAFVDLLATELKGGKTVFNQEKGRQLFGSKTGYVFVCGTTGASLIVQLAAGSNMEYAVVGQHLDLIDSTTGLAITNGSDRTVEDVDVANLTITLDTAGGVVSTDSDTRITRQGSYLAEMTGLEQIVSDTEDIYNVTTALERRWKAYVSGSTGALTDKKVGAVALAAKIRSGVWTDLIVSSPKMMMQMAAAQKGTPYIDMGRTPTPPKDVVSGYDRIFVMIEGHKMEWISDFNCPDGTIYGLATEYIGVQHLGEPDFIKIGGEILHPNLFSNAGTDTVKAVLAYYAEFTCERRNPHWKMTGVTNMSGW